MTTTDLWTPTPPSSPGFYHMKDLDGGIIPVEITQDLKVVIGSPSRTDARVDSDLFRNMVWCGPLDDH